MSPPAGSRRRPIAARLSLAAAAVALGMGVLPLLGVPCERCTGGVLSAALPWIGAAFYAGLSTLLFLRPAASAAAPAVAFAVFVHAELVAESLIVGRHCLGCFAVAFLAVLAGLVRFLAERSERVSLAASLVLGAAAAWVGPFERVDDALTRHLWPARLLVDLPPIVDRDEVLRCEHAAPLRILLYEHDCRSCTSATRRLIPRLREELGSRVCVHEHDVGRGVAGSKLPLFVLATKDRRLAVVEGRPSYREFRRIAETLLAGGVPSLREP